MKLGKKILSLTLALALVAGLLPMPARAAEPECVCETACTGEAVNLDCPRCGAEGADLTKCAKYEAPEAPKEAPAPEPAKTEAPEPAKSENSEADKTESSETDKAENSETDKAENSETDKTENSETDKTENSETDKTENSETDKTENSETDKTENSETDKTENSETDQTESSEPSNPETEPATDADADPEMDSEAASFQMFLAAAPQTLYFHIPEHSQWKDGSYCYEVFCWGSDFGKFVKMTPQGGDLYAFTLPENTSGFLFVAGTGSAMAENWSNKKYQTVDLSVPDADSENVYFELQSLQSGGNNTVVSGSTVPSHSWTKTETQPSCGKAGGTAWTCSHCNDVYNENVIPALGEHKVAGDSCTVCGGRVVRCYDARATTERWPYLYAYFWGEAGEAWVNAGNLDTVRSYVAISPGTGYDNVIFVAKNTHKEGWDSAVLAQTNDLTVSEFSDGRYYIVTGYQSGTSSRLKFDGSVRYMPVITTQPQDTKVFKSCTLSVAASQTVTSYQWYKVGQTDRLWGETSATLTVTAPGQYYCQLNCGGVNLTSQTATVTSASFDIAETSPADRTVSIVQSFTSSVTVDPDTGAAYQWYLQKPGEVLLRMDGETGRETKAFTASVPGDYVFYCDVTKGGETVRSAAMTVHVKPVDLAADTTTVTLNTTDLTPVYTGTPFAPGVSGITVRVDEKTLSAPSEGYAVEYKNAKDETVTEIQDAGVYKVIVKAQSGGAYVNQKEFTFTVTSQEITSVYWENWDRRLYKDDAGPVKAYIRINDEKVYLTVTGGHDTDGDAGDYTATASLPEAYAGNYTLAASAATKTYTVNPAGVIVTLVGQPSMVYDGSDKSTDFSGLSFRLSKWGETVPGLAADTESAFIQFNQTDAGNNLHWEIGGLTLNNSNYYISSGALKGNDGTITKRPLKITAEPQTVVYGEDVDLSVLSPKYDGFAPGEDEKVLTDTNTIGFSTEYKSGDPVGDNYTITVSGSVISNNYQISYSPAKLTVTKADNYVVSFTPNNPEYTNSDVRFSSDPVTKFPCDISYRWYWKNPGGSYQPMSSALQVGTYAVEVVGAETETAKGFTSKKYDFSVVPQKVPVTWVGVQDRTYGSQSTPVSASFTWVDGEGASHTVQMHVSGADNGNAGTYTVTAGWPEEYMGFVFEPNADSSLTQTYTVSQLAITPTITLGGGDQVYDGNEKKPPVTVTYDGISLVEDTDYTLAYTDNINAGTAWVTVTSVASSNYTFTETREPFQISKKTIAGTYTVSGDAVVGATLTVQYTGNEDVYYYWTADEDLLDEKGSTYSPTIADLGKFISVSVWGQGNYQGFVFHDGESFGPVTYYHAIHLPETQQGYTITPDQEEVNWGDTATLTLTLAEGWSRDDSFAVKAGGVALTEGPEGTFTIPAEATKVNQAIEITVEGVADKTPPDVTITLGGHTWPQSSASTETLYTKDSEFTISATDANGPVTILYSLDGGQNWLTYRDREHLPDREAAIWVKATDAANNTTEIRTQLIVSDKDAPQFQNIQNGETYCATRTFYVSDTPYGMETLKYVTIDGKAINPVRTQGANWEYSITADNKTHTITAYDKAGNSSSITVTVNDHHTLVYYYTGGNTITESCQYCDSSIRPNTTATIQAPSGSTLTYDGTAHNASVTYGGGFAAAPLTITYEKDGKTVTSTVDAGTYTASITVGGKTASVTYTVEPKEVELTWTAPQNLTYDGNAKVPTVQAKGLAEGDQVDVTASLTQGTNNENVGDFTFTATALSNPNYKLPANCVSPTYTIQQASLPAVTVTGNAVVGGTLTASLPAGVTATFQWYRNDVAIPGATGQSYTLTEADYGKTITVQATGTGNYKDTQEDGHESPVAYTHTITLPAQAEQAGYTLTATPAEVTHGESAKITFTLKEGYSKTEDFAVKVNGEAVTLADDGTYTIAAVTENLTVTVTGVADVTAPTARIAIAKDLAWTSFQDPIAITRYFKTAQTVTITADDAGSGVAGIQYFVTDTPMTLAQVESLAARRTVTWLTYTESIQLDPDGTYIVYAKVTDNAGNPAYFCSDILILDATPPVVSGVKDKETYKKSAVFTVTDANLATVKVDGKDVTPAADGKFTIPADNKTHTITATDKAGNVTTCEVTVLEVHTVKYIASGEVVSTQEVAHGQNATPPTVPYKSGYRGKWDGDGKNITADTVITAKYTQTFSGWWTNPATGDAIRVVFVVLAASALGLCTLGGWALWRKRRRP